MDVSEAVVQGAIEGVVGTITENLLRMLRGTGQSAARTPGESQTGLARHLTEVVNWSREIQFYGMSSPRVTSSSTIPLSLSMIPRRFRGTRGRSSSYSERDLLRRPGHCLLIGDPGSGKTTTLRRLAAAILSEAPSSTDRVQFPVVVRLRELRRPTRVEVVLAEKLGIPFRSAVAAGKARAPRARKALGRRRGHLVGTIPLVDFLAEFLDRSGALVLLDGLDEAPGDIREHLEASLLEFARKLASTRIIVSCRSGDYPLLEGFEVLELAPLAPSQINKIARRWLKREESEAFLTLLGATPYADLATRPLFLCQLIVIFENSGYLPERPADVCRRILTLCLVEWDLQNRVTRTSRYANFLPERKMEFLAALAYNLTYRNKVTRFSHAELEWGYREICPQFGLPPGDAAHVAQEIETHTGIIVRSGIDHYEFSHLSLQEFLCADYLVRERFATQLDRYLSEYPHPVAVATALAADPARFFAGLFLRRGRTFELSWASTRSYFARLSLERAQIVPSEFVGLAVLRVISLIGTNVGMRGIDVSDLLRIPSLAQSVRAALRRYSTSPTSEGSVLLSLVSPPLESSEYSIPTTLTLPASDYDELTSG